MLSGRQRCQKRGISNGKNDLTIFLGSKVGRSKLKYQRLAVAPSQRRFAQANTIVCCGASIVAHFARKVRATNTWRTWPTLWGMTLLDFQIMLGRRNIRPPHFASKVSYSASPQDSAKCLRGAPCSDAALAMLLGSKPRRYFFVF